MNVTKRRAFGLLLCICISMSAILANSDTLGNNVDKKKELIIVNVDDQFYTQLDQLASYVHNRYESIDARSITIKTYMSNDFDSVEKLVDSLITQGISKKDITIKEGETRLENAYFTLTLEPQPAIQ